MTDKHVLNALIRTRLDFFTMKVFETLHPGHPPLVPAWYLDALCNALQQVADGQETRLVITMPPRHLKSITAAVALPAFLLGHDPKMEIMVLSYSETLTRDHAEKFRRVVESPWYREAFPDVLITGRLLEQGTAQGGVRRAASVDGSITGLGADLIIIDDVMKADEARSPVQRERIKGWYANTVLTRLNNQNTGRIVSIQHRLHEDHLPAHLLTLGYKHLNLPAIAAQDEDIDLGHGRTHRRRVGEVLAPHHQSQERLEEIRRTSNQQVFSAQYLQNPVVDGGNLVRLDWFGSYKPHELPERQEFAKVVQSWDTAMCNGANNDYSVCTTWGFYRGEDDEGPYEECFLIDVYREKLEYHVLKSTMLELARRWRPNLVIVEHAGSGISLWQELRQDKRINLRSYGNDGLSKEERFIGCFAQIQTGRFLLPADAPWLSAFKSEVQAFPVGRNDDQVDSVSQFIRFFATRKSWFLS